MAERLGLEVDAVDVRVGHGRSAREVRREPGQADKAHEIKAVFATHNETATGVTSDVAGVPRSARRRQAPGAAVRRRRIIDRLASTSARKSGASTAACQRLAEGLHAAGRPRLPRRQQQGTRGQQSRSKHGRCYFSFEDMVKTNDLGYFPYTPATQLLRGLRASLDLIAEGGPRQHLRPPPSPRRRRAQGGRCLGPEALRQGAEVAFRHGQRHPGARRRRQRATS